ncbi:hypothetical protein KKC94_01230 [Patescibacteria group bacterium]|nr:hypothetical protein [Patescibacteria group bacterium]
MESNFSSRESAPSHVTNAAINLIELFSVPGATLRDTSYVTYDLIALSLGANNLISRFNDITLQAVKDRDYPEWTQADFELLLDYLKTNELLAKSIEIERKNVQDDLEWGMS